MKISTLIAKLGGAPALSRKIKDKTGKAITPGTVYRWGDRNTVSYRWRSAVALVAADEGISVPSDWIIFIPANAPTKGVAA